MKNKSLTKPLVAKRMIFGTSVTAALFFIMVGIAVWGGVNWAFEATNTQSFCISCHEMKDNVYPEYLQSKHYSNRAGIRATCPDCHVPRDWVHKISRKLQASSELYYKLVGSVDTKEKFEARRLYLAKKEWARMKATDSRECRNCHDYQSMQQMAQQPRAQKQHLKGLQQGYTCIDCHKGIAHKNVRDLLSDEELDVIEQPDPSLAQPDATLHVFNEEKTALLVGETALAENDAGAIENNGLDDSTVIIDASISAPLSVTENATAPPNTQTTSFDVTATIKTSSTPTSTKKIDTSPNWQAINSTTIALFYPGQASLEWVLGRKHGGRRPVIKGDTCAECHAKEALFMGKKLISGEKLETQVITNKRPAFGLTLQAAYDSEHLYFRFRWPVSVHAPVPFVNGGKMDPKNQTKIAMMIGTDAVEYAKEAGCWGACHIDAKQMPNMPSADELAKQTIDLDLSTGVSKYINNSRSDIDYKGRNGKKVGGWDKIKTESELAKAFANQEFLDLIRYSLGTKRVEDGFVFAQRTMSGGQGAHFTHQQIDGHWVVQMKRKLLSSNQGDISISPENVYNIGFAIHDDYSTGRFHHVSLGYKFSLSSTSTDKYQITASRINNETRSK